jgi:RND family efflux transporter MFP subunit
VAAGALLFSLDDRSEQAALDKARAQLARDQSTLADLERQFKRSQDLSARHFIATSAADNLQSQVESQRALLQADQAALRAAQVELGYTRIRAPSAGRVGAVNVFAGSLVQTSVTLASVTQMHPIAVSFTVPESGLAGLLDGQKRGQVAVSAALAEPARTLNGKLSFIDSAVDPVAGTIRVKAQFDNADTALWPGQFVHAKVTLATLRGAVVVPLAAIVANPGGALVYTVGDDQSAHPRPVRVLHAFGQLAAVSGLDAGEQIIVEGKQNLRPGAKVKVGNGNGSGKGGKDKALADVGAAATARERLQ